MGKRVLMVLDHEFPPDIRVEKQIDYLIQNNFEIHLLTITKIGAKELEKNGRLTIHRKPISKFIFKSSVACLLFPFYFNFWNNYIKQITSRYSFDLIHIHDLPLAKIGNSWSKKLNIPVVLDLHENWPALLKEAVHANTFLGKLLSWNWKWEAYEKEMVAQSSAIITVCEEMKQRISPFSPINEKLFVYQNVPKVKAEFLNNNYIPATNQIKLVYLGGINKNRGIQTLIKAMSLLPKSVEMHLSIIGSGSFLDQLKIQVKKYKLKDRVEFLGFLNQEKAFQKLKEHHLAVVPHYRSVQTDNSSPNKLYQYMMIGLPVISSNCSSLVRIIDQYSCGLYYQDKSPQDLANKLQQIANNPSKLLTYSKNGHRAVIQEKNIDNENPNLLKAYRWLEF